MPTLPLYDPAPPHPDGWHRVIAPGGYESWHFDAEDEAGDVRILVTFSQGSPFDGEYRRQYFAFLRKPTKRPPPAAAEFPSVSFLLWEKGQSVARFAYRYPARAFEASPGEPELNVGPHRLQPGAGGTFALRIADAAVTGGTARVAAELWFAPKFHGAPFVRRFPSREIAGGADHFWVLANPLCAVSGTVRLTEGATSSPREFHFAGRGYHDHRYGSAPIYAASGVGWTRGRALFEDRAEMFQFVVRGTENCYVRADASGINEVTPAEWQPVGQDPERLHLRDGLTLESPTEVDLGPFATTLAYDVVRAGRREGSALCEAARHGFSFPKPGGDFEDAP
jgi:hypothetical protein